MGRRIQSLDELRRPPATLPAGLRTTAKAGALPVRILGVDPGSRVTGWGLIEARGAKLSHIAHGCIKTGDGELPERLLAIHRGLQGAIVEHLPTEIAVEEVFVRINIASSLVLGQALVQAQTLRVLVLAQVLVQTWKSPELVLQLF